MLNLPLIVFCLFFYVKQNEVTGPVDENISYCMYCLVYIQQTGFSDDINW